MLPSWRQDLGRPRLPTTRKAEFISETIAGCFLPGCFAPQRQPADGDRIWPAQPRQAPATPQGSALDWERLCVWLGRPRARRAADRAGLALGDVPEPGGTQSPGAVAAHAFPCCSAAAAETPARA